MENTPVIVKLFNKYNCSLDLYFSCYHWYLIESEYDRLILYNQVKPKYTELDKPLIFTDDLCEILETNNWAELTIISFKMQSPNDRLVLDVIDVFLAKLLVENKCDCKSYILS
jgi:hypothetical protein